MNRQSGSDTRSDGGEDGSFLRRWSDRKGRVRRGAVSEQPGAPATEALSRHSPAPSPVAADPAGPRNPAASAEPELTDADMPDLESLDQDSDYSPFLSPGVSADLRREALRKLFRQPKFNVETCLEDYQDDYLNFQPLGDIMTCDMRHRAEVEARRKAEQQALESSREGARSETVPEPPAVPAPYDVVVAEGVPSAGSASPTDPDDGRGPEDSEPDAKGGNAA